MVACLLPAPVRAQQQQAAGNSTPKASTDDLYVDFAVPDVPALGLFGLNPQKVARPGNLKEFSLDLLPIAGTGNQIGSGVAFSWAPVYTFAHSVDAYRDPVLRRLSFSAATVKDSKTSTINLGAGARIVLQDGSDPVMSKAFEAAVNKVLASGDDAVNGRGAFFNNYVEPILRSVAARVTPDRSKQDKIENDLIDTWRIDQPPTPLTSAKQLQVFQDAVEKSAKAQGVTNLPPDLIDDSVKALADRYVAAATVVTSKADVAQQMKTALGKLRKEFQQKNWNATVVALDVGGLLASASGGWGDLKAEQFGSSLSAAMPLGPVGGPAQLVVQLQGRKGLGTAPKEDSFYSVGGRALVGNATKRLSLEGQWSKARSTDATANGVTKRFTIGTEFRITDGFWVEIALGGEQTPSTAAGTSIISLADLKYAFKSSPRFADVPGASDDAK